MVHLRSSSVPAILRPLLMNDLKVTDLLGLGSASAFILTVLYLYGYSITLGANLFLYFSLNDYLRFAVEWLPRFVVFGIAGWLLGRFESRLDRGLSEQEIIARSSNPRFTKILRKLTVAMIPAAFATMAAFDTFRAFYFGVREGRLYIGWGGVAAVLWVWIGGRYFKDSVSLTQ